jgi:predicted short-subunit dehydrogenase-like oxidoreductase (DUF2520 family)
VSRLRVVGPGRAGMAFATALANAGWEVDPPLRRGDDLSAAAADVDLLLLATPDAAVAGVAAAIDPVEDTVVAHVAGLLGVDVLAPHIRRGAIHPLMTLPAGDRGASNLSGGGWFAVAGDPLTEVVVVDLGGRSFQVDDGDRPLYHAAACIAANHLVALLGQVERLAEVAGVPFEAYLTLAGGALADVETLGPAAALTGPAARGDDATIAAHLAALPEGERNGYAVMSSLASVLAERQ